MMDKYALMAFPLWLHYITRGYFFEGLQKTRGYSLKKHKAVFLKRQNLTFSIAVGSIIQLIFALD